MTATDRRQRKFSNVKLTRRFHMSYMGLWLLLTVTLCIAFTVICYRLVELPAETVYSLGPGELDRYIAQRSAFLLWSTIGLLGASLLVSLLAVVTAHRVAGPYLRICAGCNAVRAGDHAYRLKFRRYDRLEFVETAFNGMLDALITDRARPVPPTEAKGPESR